MTGTPTATLDDACLGEGFLEFDGDARWIGGAAVILAELWVGCPDNIPQPL